MNSRSANGARFREGEAPAEPLEMLDSNVHPRARQEPRPPIKTLPSTALRVVLHADDLGLNSAVTDGILQGFQHGLLTSTSILSNAPDAARALSLWKKLTTDYSAGEIPSREIRRRLDDPASPFDLGVHLNLTQGRPLLGEEYPRRLLDQDGRFPGVFPLFSSLRRGDSTVLAKVRQELSRQIEFVLDHGLQPTHLNGHQYIEMLPGISALLPELLDRYHLRIVRVAEEPFLTRTTLLAGYAPQSWAMAMIKRHYAQRFRALADRFGLRHPARFHGTAHAGKIDFDTIRRFLSLYSLFGKKAACCADLIEIGLHPGNELLPGAAGDPLFQKAQADGWDDPLAKNRPQELQLLTSPELAEYFAGQQFRLGRLSSLLA